MTRVGGGVYTVGLRSSVLVQRVKRQEGPQSEKAVQFE